MRALWNFLKFLFQAVHLPYLGDKTSNYPQPKGALCPTLPKISSSGAQRREREIRTPWNGQEFLSFSVCPFFDNKKVGDFFSPNHVVSITALHSTSPFCHYSTDCCSLLGKSQNVWEAALCLAGRLNLAAQSSEFFGKGRGEQKKSFFLLAWFLFCSVSTGENMWQILCPSTHLVSFWKKLRHLFCKGGLKCNSPNSFSH